MTDQILLDQFKAAIFEALDETFENVHGVYLDKGTSLFETLDTITAEIASQPVSANCASIAAQVEHVRFSIDVVEQYMRGESPGKVDWGEIWRTVEQVTPEEWQASKDRLNESYRSLRSLLNSFDTWQGEYQIAGAMGIVIHTAYHLGEIRQALCTVSSH